jgi:uncharacterized double-CXXCG motif protein
MRYYTLTERRDVERSKWSGGYHLGRQWVLPGVECPTCKDAWSGVGHDYPTVDLSSLPGKRDFERARCVPWDEFVGLRQRVLPLVPAGAVVGPGTGFGALTGKASGKFPPVSIHMPWIILVQPPVAARLEGLTGAIPVPTRFKARPGVAELLELEVRPGGSIRGGSDGTPCRTCGRVGGAALPPLNELRLDDVPSTDFARVCPTVVAVSERVVERLAKELDESEIVAVDITGPPRRGAGARSTGIDVSP